MNNDVLAALAGTGIIAILAKWAIERALRDLENVCQKVKELDQHLAVLSVRFEKLSDHDNLLKVHTEKIAYLEVSHDLRKRSI